MPDIAKCSNTNCPSKEECFRYRVKPSKYMQSYADFKPNKDGICSGFSSLDGWNDIILIPLGALVKNLFIDEEFNDKD